jgi:hypothetical protein
MHQEQVKLKKIKQINKRMQPRKLQNKQRKPQ